MAQVQGQDAALSSTELKNGIKFLAVMQQGEHELFHYALKSYDLDLALLAAQALDMDPKVCHNLSLDHRDCLKYIETF